MWYSITNTISGATDVADLLEEHPESQVHIMRPLATVFAVILLAEYGSQEVMDSLDDVLVYPIEVPRNIEKRDTVKKSQSNYFYDFIEEKLIEHSQALEHIVKKADRNEELMKQLIENLSKNIRKPKLPEKVEMKEVHHQNRRSNVFYEDTENPFVKLGKNIPKYGSLVKDMILKEIRTDSDPIPLVERDPESLSAELLSRRSFGGSPAVVSTQQNENTISPWCSVALICKRTINPVCGYDDNFGYGKFDDLCHLLQVNCYWKYNFALVPSCNPNV